MTRSNSPDQPCKECGRREVTIRWKVFADGTRHLREDCAVCEVFRRWVPQAGRATTTGEGFLRELADRPGDCGTLGAFADWLEEQGPTPVRKGHLPRWLRDLVRAKGLPSGAKASPWPGPTAGAAAEVASWLGGQVGGLRRRAGFDGWGSTVICSRLCLVNESAGPVEDAFAYLRPLAGHLSCPLAYCRQSWHGGGAGRVLLFPPEPSPGD
jgi:uncharacterized protein (TIGR02996 family)